VSQQKKTSLRRLFKKIAFFTASGFTLESDKNGAFQIYKYCKLNKFYLTSIFILVAIFTPVALLQRLRKIRHEQA
jgi:hypothetical protein